MRKDVTFHDSIFAKMCWALLFGNPDLDPRLLTSSSCTWNFGGFGAKSPILVEKRELPTLKPLFTIFTMCHDHFVAKFTGRIVLPHVFSYFCWACSLKYPGLPQISSFPSSNPPDSPPGNEHRQCSVASFHFPSFPPWLARFTKGPIIDGSHWSQKYP